MGCLAQLLRSWTCSPLKKYLSVRSHELLPRTRWKLVSLASEWVGVFSKIYPELFPASPWSQTIFSIRSGNAIVFDPVGSKKCWRWFPATGPLEKRETALDRSWRKFRLILRRGRPNSNIIGCAAIYVRKRPIFEVKAHANVLKGTFSTDSKSNRIIIGLSTFWGWYQVCLNQPV